MFRQKTARTRFVGYYSKLNQVQRLVIGAFFMCLGTVAGEKHNYLAVIGPVQIRFQAATPQYDPATVLPPLKMSDATATNAIETVTEPKSVMIPPSIEPASVTLLAPEQSVKPEPPSVPPLESAPQSQPVLPEPRAESSQLTPQMLLRYFNWAGNREVLIPTPVEFMPPPPDSGIRSSAVYNSPPAK